MSTPDLVSKCVAIQYGVMIAGVILLVIVSFNWYQDHSNACLTACKQTTSSCKTACSTAGNTGIVGPSTFADKKKKKSAFADSTGKLSEKQLHEGFMGYSPDDSNDEYGAQINPIQSNDPEIPAYDPAKESLEQSVFDSHNEFVEDAYVSTQGPNSTNSVRDDLTGPVKQWGLKRVDYTGVFVGDDARTVSSEYADQLASSDEGSYVL